MSATPISSQYTHIGQREGGRGPQEDDRRESVRTEVQGRSKGRKARATTSFRNLWFSVGNLNFEVKVLYE